TAGTIRSFTFLMFPFSGCPCLLDHYTLTFFAAAKKDKQRKRLAPPAKRVPRTVTVVVHLESVFSHIRRE
ncbi:hypothetical protein, partial [Paraburkholderia sp.]|uniref:hypothetical protein n=1 Tax=Paraburkholderia sp. TaxID=1926495 RepID=UPI003C7B105A